MTEDVSALIKQARSGVPEGLLSRLGLALEHHVKELAAEKQEAELLRSMVSRMSQERAQLHRRLAALTSVSDPRAALFEAWRQRDGAQVELAEERNRSQVLANRLAAARAPAGLAKAVQMLEVLIKAGPPRWRVAGLREIVKNLGCCPCGCHIQSVDGSPVSDYPCRECDEGNCPVKASNTTPVAPLVLPGCLR